ncbi:hypothetical protein ACFYX5_33050 [Streptomyces rubiginosohelvolus]|uniref:hypothetical protein n=1 Tax=Streptomyces rubiginosohelvolus TaxID=67362 RepID=UPI00369AF20A
MLDHNPGGRLTVARWYALRREQPEGLGHPERVVTVDRVDFYDQAAVKAVWAAHQEAVGTGRLGVSGRRRRAGHREATGGRPVSLVRARAVQTALEEQRAAGGYRRGWPRGWLVSTVVVPGRGSVP